MAGNPEGQPEGTYLVIVSETAAGEATNYINLTEMLGAGYKSGNGAIGVSGDYKISLQLDPTGPAGLAVTASGLRTVATTVGSGNALVLRAAAGRAQVATPAAAADIANKGYVDGKITGSGAAPKPQAAAGVGQLVSVPQLTASYILPSGGTWFYSLVVWYYYGSGLYAAGIAGIAAGGTTITPGANKQVTGGFAWRIA